ncbi:RNA chaperone Hfq [Tepidanaerobacter syntrophicus]|uniref:RNA chaperone Hfq n=1 Tax=Tepidanaerobacter syntrophicus TaxID=224999 RepID=UPI00192DC457
MLNILVLSKNKNGRGKNDKSNSKPSGFFLDEIKKKQLQITIYLANGVPVKGKIIDFDNFTVLVDCGDKSQMIYKSAISTLSVPKGQDIYKKISSKFLGKSKKAASTAKPD